jgi:cell division protein FtsQ
MPDEYLFVEEVPVTDAAPSRSLDKWLRRLIVLISVILGAELLWLFVITPMMPLSVVEISGIPGIDRGAVLAQAGVSAASSYLTVDAAAAEKALAAMYQVESARVFKQYPDTVRIVLTPRQAAAMTLATLDGRVCPVYFDKFGVVVRIGASGLGAPSPALPLISGLVFERPALGMRLPVLFEPFLKKLDQLNRNSPELLSAISEIRINKKPYDGFDLILYPSHRPVRFRLGPELNEDMLRYMILMIDVFTIQGIDAEEVDLRTGTASYTLKEASSG